jgi:hypothetical protein
MQYKTQWTLCLNFVGNKQREHAFKNIWKFLTLSIYIHTQCYNINNVNVLIFRGS